MLAQVYAGVPHFECSFEVLGEATEDLRTSYNPVLLAGAAGTKLSWRPLLGCSGEKMHYRLRFWHQQSGANLLEPSFQAATELRRFRSDRHPFLRLPGPVAWTVLACDFATPQTVDYKGVAAGL
jgi:hypothetical protein